MDIPGRRFATNGCGRLEPLKYFVLFSAVKVGPPSRYIVRREKRDAGRHSCRKRAGDRRIRHTSSSLVELRRTSMCTNAIPHS